MGDVVRCLSVESVSASVCKDLFPDAVPSYDMSASDSVVWEGALAANDLCVSCDVNEKSVLSRPLDSALVICALCDTVDSVDPACIAGDVAAKLSDVTGG